MRMNKLYKATLLAIALALAWSWPAASGSSSSDRSRPDASGFSFSDSSRADARAEEIRAVVARLTDPAMEGRGPGSEGLGRAAEVVASHFKRAGLRPAGDEGGWFQSFTPDRPLLRDAVLLPKGKQWGAIRLRNVVGILPGTGEGCVVIGAHYDHLGRDADGQIFPGADDNASGVGVLCAVATELAREPARRRSILFVAFSGEEEGYLGSRWYVEHPAQASASTIAMLNLDTVGRMDGRHLLVLSSSSAAELPQMLRGVNLGFDFDLAIPEKSPLASDQIPFLEKGIPGLHFFTGPNADYHRRTDTAEKLNYGAAGKIASFVAETARFLADRDRPLTFVPPAAEKPASASPSAQPGTGTQRRVSLGTIPDFAGEGRGVLLAGVVPGSAAEKAGMQKGDRILAVDDMEIGNLEELSGVLKSHQPGDRVRVRFSRDGKEQTIEATLTERK